MADQSMMSRLGTRMMPFASRRAFPPAWMEAGDDIDRLRALAKKRRAFDGPRPDVVLRRTWSRATTEIDGHDLHLLTPTAGSSGRLLFYCHGGAFVVGPSAVEWLFASKVADRLGCDLALYDYPKVPEADASAIRAATMSAYDAVAQRYRPGRVAIGGTSAGGGLAVSTMLQLNRAGRELPSACALFSPWLDMTISHPDVDALVDCDKLLPLELLRRDGELYAGSTDLRDPLVSPRFAPAEEIAALPPMAVTAGSQEILLPEAKEFVDKLAGAGVESTLLIEPHGQHMGVAAPTPEASAVMAECIDALAGWF